MIILIRINLRTEMMCKEKMDRSILDSGLEKKDMDEVV